MPRTFILPKANLKHSSINHIFVINNSRCHIVYNLLQFTEIITDLQGKDVKLICLCMLTYVITVRHNNYTRALGLKPIDTKHTYTAGINNL